MRTHQDISAREIFLRAVEIDCLEAREVYLNQVCGSDAAFRQRIEDLLRADRQVGQPSETSLAGIPQDPIRPGTRLGGYRLLEAIGEGGCGTVFMAEQDKPVRRKVAIKVVKLGMDTRHVVARFEAERQALAMMDHPNVAKIFDAGAAASGRPYFVMELVRGIKITDYCDLHQLSTRQRLALFIQVCLAVQHAHQKGIIHRDLKPSNILVTESDDSPIPKIIDFGIAKAMHGSLTDRTLFTSCKQLIGTPAYMSPEQASLTTTDLDTRSDIYSLGVLLYEILTGRPPFDQKELLSLGVDEMCRTIREREPSRPSNRLGTLDARDLARIARARASAPPKLWRMVRGDLDWIVLKCLEKPKERRYHSAGFLAKDIESHLNNLPILARPVTFADRALRWCRRNPSVAALSLALALCLVFLAIAGPLAALRQNRLRSDAEFAMKVAHPAQDSTTDLHSSHRNPLTALDRAVQRWPDVTQLWIARARLLEQAGRIVDAENSLTHAIDLMPHQPDISLAYLNDALRTRSRLRRDLDRFAEAGEDHCRALHIPIRSPDSPPSAIDLSLFYDSPLTESLHVIKGRHGNDLSGVPSGLQSFAILPNLVFDVRGVVSLNGGMLNKVLVQRAAPNPFDATATDPDKPILSSLFRLDVRGIPIGATFHRLHCLMATGWGEQEGEVIGLYVLHYSGHNPVNLPIRYGVHVRDVLAKPGLVHDDSPTPSGKVVWRGMNDQARQYNSHIRLYLATWTNPHPARNVLHIDFVSTMSDSAPFLLAMTVE